MSPQAAIWMLLLSVTLTTRDKNLTTLSSAAHSNGWFVPHQNSPLDHAGSTEPNGCVMLVNVTQWQEEAGVISTRNWY